MLHALFVLALVWSIAGNYFLNRGKRSTEIPSDAGLSTGIEFCRQETERLLDSVRRSLLWSFGPILLAIFTFITAAELATGAANLPKQIPFMTLVAVWIAAYLWIRARQQRSLRRELVELQEMPTRCAAPLRD